MSTRTTALKRRGGSRGSKPQPGSWMLAIGVAAAILAASIPTLVMPAFQPVLDQIGGAKVPPSTQLVASYYGIVWLLPVLSVLAWYFWPLPQQRGRAAMIVGVGGLMLLIPAMIFALYLPIFMLPGSY